MTKASGILVKKYRSWPHPLCLNAFGGEVEIFISQAPKLQSVENYCDTINPKEREGEAVKRI